VQQRAQHSRLFGLVLGEVARLTDADYLRRRAIISPMAPTMSCAKVEGSGMRWIAMDTGPLKKVLAKSDPTPSGVNLTMLP